MDYFVFITWKLVSLVKIWVEIKEKGLVVIKNLLQAQFHPGKGQKPECLMHLHPNGGAAQASTPGGAPAMVTLEAKLDYWYSPLPANHGMDTG